MEQQCEELRYKEVGTLLASDAEAYGYFGISAAVDGNRLVVGADGTDTATPDAGKVYVYDWNGSAYVEVAQLTAGDAAAYAYFGVSVALAGSRLVVGASYEDTAAVNAGKVYVYDWNSATCVYDEVATITASDAQRDDHFGASVAISGNRLVVGADLQDTAGVKAGKVYVYDWTGSGYTEVVELTASDAEDNDWFGTSVALSGNRLVVGAYGEDTAALNAGKVYVYEWNSTTSVYAEVTTVTAADACAHDWFGISVALSGNRLVVGAYGVDSGATGAGKVYVYEWNGTAYIEVTTITAADADAYDLFGVSVTADGARLVVGACSVSVPSSVYTGQVYIFDQQKV